MARLRGWEPVHGAHSIQQATIMIAFAQPVGDVAWKRIEQAAAAAAVPLGLTNQEAIAFPFVLPGNLAATSGLPVAAGTSFAKMERPDFYSEKLSLLRNTLTYENWSYTRWSPMLNRCERLLGGLVDKYAAISSLAQVVCTYVDQFRAADRLASGASEVVDRSSPYVAPRAFDEHEPWHCHSGTLAFPDDSTRRVTNVNIDVADNGGPGEGPTRVIQIFTQVSDQFGQTADPLRVRSLRDLDDGAVDWPFCAGHLADQHRLSKATLIKVLTASAAASISLR